MIKILNIVILSLALAQCNSNRGGGNKEYVEAIPNPPLFDLECDNFKSELALLEGDTSTRDSIYKVALDKRDALKNADIESLSMVWNCHEQKAK